MSPDVGTVRDSAKKKQSDAAFGLRTACARCALALAVLFAEAALTQKGGYCRPAKSSLPLAHMRLPPSMHTYAPII